MDFFKKKYDYIIVGGGIGGLFLAYKLCEMENKKILLVEKSAIMGGRIHTYKSHIHSIQYEVGAARFNENHTKLITLIKDLGLLDEVEEITNVSDHVLRNENCKTNTCTTYNLRKDIKDEIDELSYDELIKKVLREFSILDKSEYNYLMNITFYQYCVEVLGNEGALFLKDSFGYSAEFINGNAYNMIKLFENNFDNIDIQYYVLKNGLSSIVERILIKLGKCDNVDIKLKTNIVDINLNTENYYYIETGDKSYYYGVNIILTIPQKSLLELDILSKNPKINQQLRCVVPVPLCRIYGLYDKCWYKDIPKTTTDSDIRFFIPINYEEGNALVMLTYSDSLEAERWRNIYKLGDEQLVKTINRGLKEMFPKVNIEENPKYINAHYWGEGCHLWGVGCNPDTLYEEIMQPIKNKKLYIGGECYSMNQGWIEGSLETCYSILMKLDVGNYDVVKNKSKSLSIVKEVVDNSKEIDDVVEDKKYTINEIMDINKKNKDKLIILDLQELLDSGSYNDLDGEIVEYTKMGVNKRVYSIKEWYEKHPGGPRNLDAGINANEYYLDSTKSEMKPIELFIQMEHGEHVIKRYLLSENEYVKYMGYM